MCAPKPRHAAAWLGLPVFLIPAALTLLARGFLWSDDGALHLYRVFELDRALSAGDVYPRWAPDLVSGYGVPLFDFYPPLAYYIGEIFHVLGLPFYDSLKATMAVCLFVSAVGMFLLASDLLCQLVVPWKRRAALAVLAACAYTYAPYLLADLYYRGAVAEALAMSLLPGVLWAVRRAASKRSRANVILAGALGALLILSHHLTALFAAPLVICFGLIELLFLPTWPARLFGFTRLAAGAVLTVCLSAFYWLPAVAEQQWVRVSNELSPNGPMPQMVQEHLQSLSRLFDLSWFYSYHTPSPWQLPVSALVLTVLSLLLLVKLPSPRIRAEFLVLAAFACAAIILMGDWTRELWRGYPLFTLIQFPWRLSVLVALAAALGVCLIPLELSYIFRKSRWILPASLRFLGATAIVGGIFYLEPILKPIDINQSVNVATLARWEVNFNTYGASDLREFFPLTVKALPREVNRQLLDTHLLSTDQVSDIQLEQAGPTQMFYRIRSAVATSVFFRTFYFPDWRVLVDGQPASAQARTAFGILGVSLPAGEHRLTVARGTTLSRQWGEGLTWLGLLLTGVLLVLAARRREVDVALPVLLLVVTGVIAALAIWPSFVRPLSDYAPAQLDLNPNLHVIGYSADEVGNDALHVRVMWQARLPITEDAPIHWRLLDGNGSPVSEFRQRSRYGTGLMTTWLPNEIAFDDFDLPLNRAAAGNYLLQVAADNSAWMPLGHVMLPRAAPGFRPPALAHPVQARLGDSIDLLGYSTDERQTGADLTAQPGERLPLTFYWTTHDGVLDDLAVFIHVVDSTGNLAAQEDSQPNQRFSPTYAWLPGRVVADTHILLLPADIPPGSYHLLVGMYSFPSIDRLPVKGASLEDDTVDIATLHVQPVER